MPDHVTLLSTIRDRMARNLSQVPNYTCLQTIERSQRRNPKQDFKNIDTVRLEVALVAGKELFSWPGAGKFEERDLGEIVGGGTTTTGDYALHARTVFGSRVPAFQFVGEVPFQGRPAIRFDYKIAAMVSGYLVRVGDKQAKVPYHGSFWVEQQTLDLLRLEVITDDIPAELAVAYAETEIDYGKVKVGGSDFLLPRRVEFRLRHDDGSESRNRSEFARCRQYVGESEISFREPSARAELAVEQQITEIELPPGLTFDTRLKTPIDSKTSMIGDAVTATLPWTVKKDGKTVAPKGAVLHGRIRQLDRVGEGISEYFLIGIELSDLQFATVKARFVAQLKEIGPFQGVSARQMLPLPEQDMPGVGKFLLRTSRARLPEGLRMVWITVPAGTTRPSP